MKEQRLDWLAKIFSSDAVAMSDEVTNEQLFDRFNDFGMAHFVNNFRPLAKLRDARGPLTFDVGAVEHAADDLSYVELCLSGEVIFMVRVRFEAQPPYRIRYWSPYKPLPEGVRIRPYQPDDAAGCAALELACPMEAKDGSEWVIDRGDKFDDYLQLIAPFDAAVVEFDGQIVGFFSCALRDISLNGEACFAAYQHHWRVHPDHRAGSVSQALAAEVDARRTFDGLNVALPYSLVDPDNLHMQHMGFPPLPGVQISRLNIPTTLGSPGNGDQAVPLSRVMQTGAHTHGQRTLYRNFNQAQWEDRLSRIPDYGINDFRANEGAVLGVWAAGEHNVLRKGDETRERYIAFALDYGYENLTAFQELLLTTLVELRERGMTHLAVTCDSRADEYQLLSEVAEDEQRFAFHTLPWMAEPLSGRTLYYDAAYV